MTVTEHLRYVPAIEGRRFGGNYPHIGESTGDFVVYVIGRLDPGHPVYATHLQVVPGACFYAPRSYTPTARPTWPAAG